LPRDFFYFLTNTGLAHGGLPGKTTFF